MVLGDCMEDSLIGEGPEDGEPTVAFSLPVTASEIALRPMRGFAADLGVATEDRGEPFEDFVPLICGEDEVMILIVGFPSYSSLVTLGWVRSLVASTVGAVSCVLEARNRPLRLLLWYTFDAVDVIAAIVSRIESTLPTRECRFDPAMLRRCSST